MTDLLHWYARIHGSRALRIVEAARAGELDGERADAASAVPALVAESAGQRAELDAST